MLPTDTEVVADLSECDFQLPALREPAEDLQWLLRQVGAEQGLWVEAPAGVAQGPVGISVYGRSVERHGQARALVKRSPNRTAN